MSSPPARCLQGRLTKDIGKLVAERAELADKVASLQASVYKANEKLDGFKLLMNWNQEEMEQWALAQRQKEEDNTALEKYKKQDAAKASRGMSGRLAGGGSAWLCSTLMCGTIACAHMPLPCVHLHTPSLLALGTRLRVGTVRSRASWRLWRDA